MIILKTGLSVLIKSVDMQSTWFTLGQFLVKVTVKVTNIWLDTVSPLFPLNVLSDFLITLHNCSRQWNDAKMVQVVYFQTQFKIKCFDCITCLPAPTPFSRIGWPNKFCNNLSQIYFDETVYRVGKMSVMLKIERVFTGFFLIISELALLGDFLREEKRP